MNLGVSCYDTSLHNFTVTHSNILSSVAQHQSTELYSYTQQQSVFCCYNTGLQNFTVTHSNSLSSVAQQRFTQLYSYTQQQSVFCCTTLVYRTLHTATFCLLLHNTSLQNFEHSNILSSVTQHQFTELCTQQHSVFCCTRPVYSNFACSNIPSSVAQDQFTELCMQQHSVFCCTRPVYRTLHPATFCLLLHCTSLQNFTRSNILSSVAQDQFTELHTQQHSVFCCTRPVYRTLNAATFCLLLHCTSLQNFERSNILSSVAQDQFTEL